MKKTFLILFLLFYSGASIADTEPTLVRVATKGNCQEYAMCAAQTATGACTVLPASGDERVLDVFTKGLTSLTFFANDSVGNYSCNVFGNSNGFDASSGDGVQLNSRSITQNTQGAVLSAAGLGHIWVACTAVGTSVTMTVNACP